MKPFFVYLLRCADGAYYAGHTDDLERRVAEHQSGATEGYTHGRRPVELVWAQETATREEALAAELRIKGWSRAKKEALMAGDWERVKVLARSALRRAQGERGGSGRALHSEARPTGPAHPEPVEGPAHAAALHSSSSRPPQALEQGAKRTRTSSSSNPAHPEPVEGSIHATTLHSPSSGRSEVQAQSERAGADESKSLPPDPAHPEPVEGPANASLAAPLLRGDRRALAKAITLLESTRGDHRARADALLNALLRHTGKAMRLGISGVPGVGKSTFIEALGLMLISQGHRVAVLAVDPSSSLGGGSILGDKTRMERLSVAEAAYIRPSPASGTLGGVAEKTREAMLVCEAAGYDVVIVETVGIGQSETAVASMTDMFVLLQLPNAGDDLQAIKKGVMELADLVVINKADLDPAAATRAQAYISSSLRLFGAHGSVEQWQPQVMPMSALTGDGLAAFWSAVQEFHRLQRASGAFDLRRRKQALAWMWDTVHARLQADFHQHPAVRQALPDTVRDVTDAHVAPSAAARRLLDLFERPTR